MAFATAWTGLIDIGRLSAGQTVLITAASSSTGLAAIQVAKKVGATPVALTRTFAKAAALVQAGAAHVIATEEQDLAREVAQFTGGRGAELVFDAVGGPNFEKLADAAAVGSILIVYGRFSPDVTPLPIAQTLWKDLTIRGFGLPTTIARDDKLAAVKQFVNEGLTSGALRPDHREDIPVRRYRGGPSLSGKRCAVWKDHCDRVTATSCDPWMCAS